MLIPRILTALVGIPIVIACIYYGGLAFYIMFFAVVLFSVMEFYSVCKKYNPMSIMGTLVAIVFYLSLCTGTYVQEVLILSVFILFFFAMFKKSVDNISANLAVTCFGAFFITWTLFHMVLIRDIPKHGMHYIIFLFVNLLLYHTVSERAVYIVTPEVLLYSKYKLSILVSFFLTTLPTKEYLFVDCIPP